MSALTVIDAADNRQALIQTVLDGMTSPHSKRAYARALGDFLSWHTEQGQPALTKSVINAYKSHLEAEGRGLAAINQTLCAIRKLVKEAADNGAIDATIAAGIGNVKGIKTETLPAGRSISAGEIAAMLTACNDQVPAGARDAAIIAVLYAGGLRRAELVGLDMADFDPATGELKILHAKGRKQRTAHITNGAKLALLDWLTLRGSEPGPLFCQVKKGGHIWKNNRLTEQAVYHVLQARAEAAGVKDVSPHDFRRSFVSDLLDAGADLATVQKMAGHADVSTTARYDRRGEEAKRKAAGLLHVPYAKRTL